MNIPVILVVFSILRKKGGKRSDYQRFIQKLFKSRICILFDLNKYFKKCQPIFYCIRQR